MLGKITIKASVSCESNEDCRKKTTEREEILSCEDLRICISLRSF
jgi:hypothetical protein